MSSLLTNNSAMVALQTLKTINKNMAEVQNEVSTGKRIANARDNAALWGISTTMSSDVSGFKAISESLSLGSATLTVGREAAETVADLLDQLKGRVVAAQEENVDRNKIQADVVALRDQILTVVEGAQFNGLNLLKATEDVKILASLNRDANGNVTPSHITFSKQKLTTDESTWNAAGSAIGGISKSAAAGGFLNQIGVTTTMTTVIDTATTGVAGTFRLRFTATAAISGDVRTFDLQVTSGGSGDVAADLVADIQAAANLGGNAAQLTELGITVSSTGADLTITTTNDQENITVAYVAGGSAGEAAPTFSTAGNLAAFAPSGLNAIQETATLANRMVVEGDTYRITAGGVNFDYVARDGETVHDVAAQLVLKINANATLDLSARLGEITDPDTEDAVVYIHNTSGTTASGGAAIAYTGVSDMTDGIIGGGLEGLDLLDVTTADGAAAALQSMERMIQSAISAAAAFGSSQGRIQTQSEFVSKIMDGLTSGIGALVDADMEAASARLQALQVQQQLGIQALSIANQQPQNILALFRQ